MDVLEAAIGYTFHNPALLEQALTHGSYLANNPDATHGSNERLEFLGDAVLGYLSAERLYRDYPDRGEGELSQLRAALVRRENLAAWAEEIALGRHLRVGRGMERAVLSDEANPRVLANAFEALLGAMLLDGGLEAVTNFLAPRLSQVDAALARQTNYKGQLMETAQAQFGLTPVYRSSEAARQFTAEVLLPGQDQPIGQGQGRNKQIAEQAAAQDALSRMTSDELAMYTFKNDKVRLRAVTMSDAADHWQWRNDPEVTRTLLSGQPRSMAEVEDFVSRWMEGGGFAIEAIDLPEPVHIGSCSLFDIQWRSRHAELGINIGAKQYWGRGYATAAMQLLLEYGFGELNLHRIQLYVFSYNLAAISVYKKVGFQIEATLRQDVYREDVYHDTYLMGILKREWEQLRAAEHQQKA